MHQFGLTAKYTHFFPMVKIAEFSNGTTCMDLKIVHFSVSDFQVKFWHELSSSCSSWRGITLCSFLNEFYFVCIFFTGQAVFNYVNQEIRNWYRWQSTGQYQALHIGVLQFLNAFTSSPRHPSLHWNLAIAGYIAECQHHFSYCKSLTTSDLLEVIFLEFGWPCK